MNTLFSTFLFSALLKNLIHCIAWYISAFYTKIFYSLYCSHCLDRFCRSLLLISHFSSLPYQYIWYDKEHTLFTGAWFFGSLGKRTTIHELPLETLTIYVLTELFSGIICLKHARKFVSSRSNKKKLFCISCTAMTIWLLNW